MRKQSGRHVGCRILAPPANGVYVEGMGTTYSDLFAANLRAARARAGISQKVLAARMNRLGFDSWFDTKVSRTERGSAPVLAGEVLGLAVCLGCSIRDLVGEAAPNAIISFPDERFEVSGVMVRNSGYGWNDASVTWDEGSEDPVIIRPASMQSAFAQSPSPRLAAPEPPRFARTVTTVEQIKHEYPELARPAS